MGSEAKASRHLEYIDGSSKKFWTIELDGASHTVQFGRIGTDGQTKTKDFGSEDEAQKSYDKLVAEKLKKGYADVGGALAGPPATSPGKKASKTSPGKKASKTSPGKKASKTAPSQATAADSDGGTAASGAFEPEGPPAAAGTADVAWSRELSIALHAFYQATFDLPPPITPSPAAPFDKDACMTQLSKLRTASYGWEIKWPAFDVRRSISPAEGHFWLWAATTEKPRDEDMKQFAARMTKVRCTGKVSAADVIKRIGKSGRCGVDVTMYAAAHLLSVDDLMDVVASQQPSRMHDYVAEMHDGWRKFVVPRLTADDRSRLAARLKESWPASQLPAADYFPFVNAYYLAATLGLSDALRAEVEGWPEDMFSADDPWKTRRQRPQDIIFGLGSPDLIVHHMRRLKLRLCDGEQLHRYLACTRFDALDVVETTLDAPMSKDEGVAFMEAFARAKAPEMAPVMLRQKGEPHAPAVASAWLDENPGRAIFGLISASLARGKLADAAIAQLRTYRKRGYGEVVEAAFASASGEPAWKDRVEREVLLFTERVFDLHDADSTPAALKTSLTFEGRAKKLPPWLRPGELPPMVVAGRRLNEAQVQDLLQLLMATAVSERHPALDALRDLAEPSSRGEFAWALFESWQTAGADSKNKWAMVAIGHLGDDAAVLKLTPLIKAWPGESQHARAVLGLECLGAAGTNTALMQLSGIAQKLKFKGLKAKAQQFVNAIAKERGMTRDELEDRVVPDCGLDPDGRRTFSFGPREFTFVLSNDLKAKVKDAAGKVRDNLPKPGQKDDATASSAAVDEWKLLKKQIKEVATIQAGRLEQAMITGRRWPATDFETLLVAHPLMTHLAQKIVWGAYGGGKRVATFRVTEERDLADVNDEAWTLDPAQQVGIVHPLDLDDGLRDGWGQVMGDYELVAPFPQLGRDVHALEPGEEGKKELDRFKGLSFSAPTLVFNLDKMGWIRGEAMDAGGFDEHSKQFPAAGVTAVVDYDGIVSMGYIDPDEELKLGVAYFCRGMRAPSGYGWDKKNLMKLGDVPKVVVSEVLADLQFVASKGR